MNEAILAIAGAFSVIFGYFTARLTMLKSKNDFENNISKTSFETIIKRLEVSEVELKQAQQIQLNFTKLTEQYNNLTEDYDMLLQEKVQLKKRVQELESNIK